MPFSGKPSKGCGPCRKLRTKCDLAVPSCTQCIRKGRVCTGYRDELEIIFRNQTPEVVKKAKRKRDAEQARGVTYDFANTQQPSRKAAVNDEAIWHFFAHWNEKFYASQGENLVGGFDYILPVFEEDVRSIGPVPEIVRAIGLAALGNTKGAPGLLVQARQKQVQVLRHLSHQLQEPDKALSDSSILTCILLSLFESIICEPQSTQAMTYHLKGALTLAQLRGPAQFDSEVGHGIYSRLRGFMLAHCLQTREPLPGFVIAFLDDEGITQRDFEPFFYRLLAQLCQLRAEQKTKGFVDSSMAEEAQQLADILAEWQPSIPDWQPDCRPIGDPTSKYQQDDTYRVVWLAAIWLFKQTSRILALDIVIEWARAQTMLSPGGPAGARLELAISMQRVLGTELADSTEYYMQHFRDTETSTRVIGGYGLLWPLYVLSTSSTSTQDTMIWITQKAEEITEEFGIRQGKTMADFIKMYTNI
ncbi:hypothetical protein B0J11DRAFT_157423 [Dendryphion nanum]|uniref:Zn(2)-C6 fungal-type domain-containing protein n=1 Tax=Dendryphion nanum TaxID=256645 RepID=A0A9P9IVQ1_9PLEO|nr:hypothetical protein B0J11DRAFT_157423 [Dendryphion nanum]